VPDQWRQRSAETYPGPITKNNAGESWTSFHSVGAITLTAASPMRLGHQRGQPDTSARSDFALLSKVLNTAANPPARQRSRTTTGTTIKTSPTADWNVDTRLPRRSPLLGGGTVNVTGRATSDHATTGTAFLQSGSRRQRGTT